jgi:ATP-dependent DNA helicase RecG
VDNILEARYSRNPKIVRTLNRYKNPPNKDMGEGLNTAFQKMNEMQLAQPIIRAENNYVRAVIPHQRLASPETAILEFLANNSQITNSMVRGLTGIQSESTVKDVFRRLRKRGMIEIVPGSSGNQSAWRLIDTDASAQAVDDNQAAQSDSR